MDSNYFSKTDIESFLSKNQKHGMDILKSWANKKDLVEALESDAGRLILEDLSKRIEKTFGTIMTSKDDGELKEAVIALRIQQGISEDWFGILKGFRKLTKQIKAV